jgi:hypothetical protein
MKTLKQEKRTAEPGMSIPRGDRRINFLLFVLRKRIDCLGPATGPSI